MTTPYLADGERYHEVPGGFLSSRWPVRFVRHLPDVALTPRRELNLDVLDEMVAAVRKDHR